MAEVELVRAFKDGNIIVALGELQGGDTFAVKGDGTHGGALAMRDPTNTYTTMLTGGAITSDIRLTLPTTEGIAGQILFTDGNGNLGYTDSISLSDLTVPNIQIAVTDTQTIDTTSGNLVLNSASGQVTVGNNLVVTGELTVMGATTTVNSTTVTVDDPVFTLGGDTAPASDDNKDRGIEFKWHDGAAAKVGFFGWDDSANTTVLQAPNTRSLSFQVNSDTFSSGTEAIRIDSSGNVGIGTSSPATTLESKIGTSGLPATSGTTPANVALRLSSTATTGIIDMGLNGPNPWIQVTDRTNLGVPYNLLLNPNGGNVGIGGTTASPAGFVKSLNLEGSDVALQLRETTTNSSWEIGNDNTGLFRILNDGTERLRITSTGKVETKGRDYGFINHGTPVTIADDSTIVLNANEIGAGILTVYHRPSGQWCNFGVGYNGATIMSALNSSNFDVIDTDGRFCVIAVNHTITLKNRFGSSAGFYINFVMAGNDFAG